MAGDLDPKFPADLLVHHIAGDAVDRAVGEFDRLAIEHRQLGQVRLRDVGRYQPGAGSGHLDLSEDQRLDDVTVGK